MNKLKLRKKGCLFIALGLIVSMVVAVSYSGKVNSSANSEGKNTAKDRLLAKRNEVNKVFSFNENASEEEVVRAIVTLKEDSVVETGIGDVTEYTAKLKSRENKIIKNQDRLIKQAEKLTGNKVENQSAYLVNSFSIDATRKQMKDIVKIDGVEAVYEASKYKINMKTAVKEGNVYNQWIDAKYGYTGEGVVIAVLDTGVNYKHKDMVIDKGVKTKFTKEEWEEKIKLLGYGKYFTEKVPFGYNYVDVKDECLCTSDYNGRLAPGYHGYHVSGIATGNNDDIKGVAKNAQVIGLKVMNDTGYGTTDDMVKGVEDAVKLGADIINMSIGDDCGVVSDENFLQVAVNNAKKEGVICCVSAGNAGTSSGYSSSRNNMNMTDTAMITTPAVSKSCLAVASANNVTFNELLLVKALVGDKELSFTAFDPVEHGFNIKNIKLISVGRGAKAEEIKGKIAVVPECKSEQSSITYDLSEAGAAGIILISDKEKITEYIKVADWNKIPVIIVGKTEGKALIEAADKGENILINSISNNGELHSDITMSKFTSWGPTNELGIKPEITAPGGDIYAAEEGIGSYGLRSGTSMASPFIAGSEAIMLQAIRERGILLEGEQLVSFMKNALMNTADAIIDKETGNYYSVRQQGSGIVDVYGAVDNEVLVTYNGEAKVELGEITSNREIELIFTNYGKKDRSYNVSDIQIYTDYTANDGTAGLKPVKGASIVFGSDHIVVPAGKSVTLKGTVNIENRCEKDSYVEAFIRFTGENVQDIGLPVLGFYGDFDKEPIIDRPLYDGENSFISEKLQGFKSYTSLAEVDEHDPVRILGEEIIKEKNDNVREIIQEKKVKILEDAEIERVELDKKYNIDLASDKVYCAEYSAKSNGYISFNIDVDGFINYSLFKVKRNAEGILSSEPIFVEKNTVEGKFSKEIKAEQGFIYRLELSNSSEYEVKGSLDLQKSDGSNYYILKKSYYGDKVAFSPNADGITDKVGPAITQIRNAKEIKVSVLDSNKNVIRVLGIVNDIPRMTCKSIVEGNYISVINTLKDSKCIAWDGTVYDKATGMFKNVSEGQYYIQIESKRMIDSEPQVMVMPVKVDVSKPKFNNFEVKKENKDTLVYLQPSDDIGLSSYYYIDIETNRGEASVNQTIARDYATTKRDEKGRYIVNLGNTENVKSVTFMIEDLAGNITYETVKTSFNDKINEEADEKEQFREDVKEEAIVEVLDLELFKEVKKARDTKTIALVDNITYPFSFQIKVNKDKLDSDALKIYETSIYKYINWSSQGDVLFSGNAKRKIYEYTEREIDNYSCKYEGNGIFTITLKEKIGELLDIRVMDNCELNQMLYLCEDKTQFDSIIDYCAHDINLSLSGSNVRKDDLNKDGTLNLTGDLEIVPKALKVNGIDATLDEKAHKFEVNIPIKHGDNLIVFDSIYKGDSNQLSVRLYNNEISIMLNNLPKEDNKGIINVNNEMLRLTGTIKSYINIGSIDVNGDNIYSINDCKVYTEEKPFVKNFDYNVALQKGMNTVTMVVKDSIGNEETVELKVNYK